MDKSLRWWANYLGWWFLLVIGSFIVVPTWVVLGLAKWHWIGLVEADVKVLMAEKGYDYETALELAKGRRKEVE